MIASDEKHKEEEGVLNLLYVIDSSNFDDTAKARLKIAQKSDTVTWRITF